MPWYRMGSPGEDCVAHLCRMKSAPQNCAMPLFEKDNPEFGPKCGRMSVALCDSKGCDKPICELHRTKHTTKSDTDFCPDHKDQA